MGLFSSRSSSSSTQNTYNTDERFAVGANSIGVNADGGVNVTSTTNYLDGGAIARAFGFADSAVGKTLATIDKQNAIHGEGFSALLDAAEGLWERGEKLIGQTQQHVADAYSQAQTDKAGTIDNRTIIVLAVAGAVVVYAMTRRK